MEVKNLDKQLEAMERRGVELEKNLRHSGDGSAFPVVLRSVRTPPPSRARSHGSKCVVSISEEKEEMLMEWFALNHERHVLVRRDMELGYV